jgi:hypothetical protein
MENKINRTCVLDGGNWIFFAWCAKQMRYFCSVDLGLTDRRLLTVRFRSSTPKLPSKTYLQSYYFTRVYDIIQ